MLIYFKLKRLTQILQYLRIIYFFFILLPLILQISPYLKLKIIPNSHSFHISIYCNLTLSMVSILSKRFRNCTSNITNKIGEKNAGQNHDKNRIQLFRSILRSQITISNCCHSSKRPINTSNINIDYR